MADALAAGGTFPHYLGPDALKALVAVEIVKWTPAARDANVEPQ